MKKEDIVCVAMTTWDGDYVKSVVKLTEALSYSAKVLFVNYQYTWKDLLMALVGRSPAPWRKMLGLHPKIECPMEGREVFVLTPPPVLPINWIRNKKWHSLLNHFNGLVLARSIRWAMGKLKMSSPIMINAFNPVVGVALQQRIPANRTYYYCYDEIDQSPWCQNHGTDYEKLLTPRLAGILATSEGLVEKFRKDHERVEWLPNGVDYSLFNRVLSRPASVAAKRICFLGSLDFRIDYDLLYQLAKGLPHVIFDLVGRVVEKQAVNTLLALPNVQVHGAKSPEELPEYLSRSTVAIIPFIKNEFTRNIYPMKVNEYLAAGLPVITTDFAPLKGFQGLIQVAPTIEKFLEGVNQALEESDPTLVQTRRNLAKSNSWQARSQVFWDFHGKCLQS